ncbi:MAG TPA: MFS transporter, partial [Micromonosporaceae bacterium]|nr:MFS transporter [Micromonosporaceae bacterium]
LVTAVVSGTAAGYATVAVVLVALALPFALTTPDDPLPREHRPPQRARQFLAGFWVSPRRHPDFAWAWVTRFAVQLGNALGTLYLLYFLSDAVGLDDAEAGLLVLILIYSGALVATAVVSGVLSDRTGRRKPFVIAAGVVMAVAAGLLAGWPTWPVAVVAAGILGAGYGIYAAVDAALITQVLPTATGRAKDLGVINIANSAPQVLGPALAAPVVASFGGYPMLYLLTAAVTLLGSVLVVKIRSVA